MPGSSLWLVPPPTHPLHDLLSKLITTTLPATYSSSSSPSPPKFSPHLTLTSQIDPRATYQTDANAQAWLDRLPLSAVRVVFERVATQDVFFRRCYIKCEFDGVKELVGVAREWGVEGGDEEKTRRWLDWWREDHGPHVSLIYGNEPISEEKLKEIDGAVREAGVVLGEEEGATTTMGEMGGWEGGLVWLVPTDRDISEWKPIATRTL